MTSPPPPTELSIALPSFRQEEAGDWSPLIDLAVAADRAGVDRVVVSEHVAFGERLEAYADPRVGGQRDGRQPTTPDGAWLDPLVTLSYLAALTQHVRLGTAVLLAAMRRPVVLAKTAASLDVLSCGRLDLGVGVGWQREEYEAAGLPFARRGQLLDHTLEVCQTLWRNRVADYRSPQLSFAGIHQAPKPVQAGGVPIWVSGTVQDRSMDRLARFGTGWIPWGDDAQDVTAGIERMRRAMQVRGRAGEEIRVSANVVAVRAGSEIDLQATFADVARLRQHGVTDFRLRTPIPTEATAVEDFLRDAVAAFRAALS